MALKYGTGEAPTVGDLVLVPAGEDGRGLPHLCRVAGIIDGDGGVLMAEVLGVLAFAPDGERHYFPAPRPSFLRCTAESARLVLGPLAFPAGA